MQRQRPIIYAMKQYIVLLIFFLSSIAIYAQDKAEVYLQADLTSAYLWRGQKCAGPSIQPVLGLKWKGLDVFFWGNEQLAPPSGKEVEHEIDLSLTYSPCRYFNFGFRDVYINTRGKGVFSFGSIPDAANCLDAFVAFDFKYVNFEWSTTIAGYDGYNHHGRRAYGSYLVVNAPFSFAKVDWNARVGIVPYYCSRYAGDNSDGFHVNMCSLKAAHTFALPKIHSSLTPYLQLMVNPSAKTAYFQAAVRFAFKP